MNPLLQGILMGLTITLSVGPGFIAIFQTSIMRGIKAGFTLATGILMSDLVLISISYLGLTKLLSKSNYLAMGVIAGIILIITGIISLFLKPANNLEKDQEIPEQKIPLPLFLVKGFLLNIANPFGLIFWIGVMSFAASTYGMHTTNFFSFFAGLISIAFTSDLLKCYFSSLLRKMLTPDALSVINKITGILLIIAGAFVVWHVSF